MSEAPAETVTLTIDGHEITVPRGTLVIRAAEQLGTIVPRFCDHPLLDPVGACRQCVVEVEGQRKPMMACTTPVTDGMEVRTHLTSAVARKAQEGTLEFLLINHPLDCPMCDKGGECPLQDQALAHGSNTSRFIDQKRRYLKPVAISEQILLDRERCVLCARCTRFAEQISGDPFIELFERGALEQVAIYEDEPYHSYFAGNIIQICPVGALTSVDYRFRARPFDVVTAPSVCDHCSAGCTLTVQARRGDIQRQLARTNMPVNEAWSCDKGRFAYGHLTSSRRVTSPRLRSAAGELADATWGEALVAATDAVLASRREHGSARVAVLTGSRLADEDAYAVAKYARSVLGTDDVDFRTRAAPRGEADELAALQGRATATYADVEAAPVIVVAGLDPEEEVPILFLRLRKAWRNHKARLVVLGPVLGSLAEYAWRRVATAPGHEAAALREIAEQLDASSEPDEIAAALRDAEAPVVLVGERAGAGSVTAAAALAEASGAALAWLPRRAGARGALEAGLAAGLLPGGRRLDDDADRAEVEAEWGALPDARGRDGHDVLAAAAAGEIDVLHLVGVDLLRDCDAPGLAARALRRAGTVIAQDLALNDTVAEHAHVVLPATGTQERHGSMTNWEGRTQRFARAVDGPRLVLDDWEIVRQLAALLGEDLGFSDLEGLRREVERLGVRAEPHAWPAPSGPEAGSDDEEEGLALVRLPLLLDRGEMLTGADDLLATAKGPWVGLNARDAEALAIADGDLVEVAGSGASLRLPARIGGDIAPGCVFVPANSTDVPAAALVEDEASARVRVAAVADAEVRS